MINRSYQQFLRSPVVKGNPWGWLSSAASSTSRKPLSDNSLTSTLPEITLPASYRRKLDEKIQKLHNETSHGKNASLSDLENERILKLRSKLLIQCSDRKKNHYESQDYKNWCIDRLASCSWARIETVGEFFVVKPLKGSPPALMAEVQQEKKSKQSEWNPTGIPQDSKIAELLRSLKFNKPTLIQQMVIPTILHGDNVICIGETGGGKTLAFLLPLLHKLTTQMNQSNEAPWTGPSIIVLIPILTLREQFMKLADVLCSQMHLRVTEVDEDPNHEKTLQVLRDRLEEHKPHILTLSPKAFNLGLKHEILKTSSIQSMVFDEADFILTERDSMECVKNIIRNIPIRSDPELGDGCQMILVSATMPQNIEQIFSDIIPLDKLVKIRSPFAHRVLHHITQMFMRVTLKEKFGTLLSMLYKKKANSTIIFCTKKETAMQISSLLCDNNIENRVLVGSMTVQERSQALMDIASGTVKVLVTTDMAAHGLDLPCLSCVVNYDFPRFIGDYLHRIGRVGRVGSHQSGMVINFISLKYEVPLVQKIETAIRHGGLLEGVGEDYQQFLHEKNSRTESVSHANV